MLKETIVICLVILLLFTVNGCISTEEEVGSEEEAQEAVMDISEEISEISDSIKNINEELG